jgi:hypothetical protein
MKLCWDNIENIRLTKNGRFRINDHYYDIKICKKCGSEYLGRGGSKFCSYSCIRVNEKHTEDVRKRLSDINRGRKHTEEHNRRIGNSQRGRKLSSEQIEGLRASRKGVGNPMYGRRGQTSPHWKGGVVENKIPLYDTYASQIGLYEEVRRNDLNIMEVRCAYCAGWFIPNINSVYRKIQSLKSNENYSIDVKFYCSKACKQACPLYGKSAEQLMKADAIRTGRLGWLGLNREVQAELRQLVLARDGYKCQKCDAVDGPLHCHHILPVAVEPILSADIDNCVTLCSECHKEAHQKDGCRYNQLRIC